MNIKMGIHGFLIGSVGHVFLTFPWLLTLSAPELDAIWDRGLGNSRETREGFEEVGEFAAGFEELKSLGTRVQGFGKLA